MKFKLIPTPFFEKELKTLAKKYPALKNDIAELGKLLLENPTTIGKALGKDCYKIRMAITGRNSGKSGGARVITHVVINKGNIYLVSIYDKAEKENITDKLLLSLLKQIED